MTPPIINTPRGTIVQTANGKEQLTWNTNFQPKWQRNYTDSQKFVDSEVVRLCEPYTPLLTSMLVKSGTLGTIIGSGEVSWIAPYARNRYYTPRKSPSTTGPLRGPFWFERMKSVYRDQILSGAKKFMGRK